MQDFQAMGSRGGGGGGGGGGRVFGVDRRARQLPNQTLKCPRCDSLNTKFCYYNNYNLSQPRHFCKNCRRYWTKGGILRNVPVGGGCRKNKRSKPKPNSEPREERKPTTSHSSSESSTHTTTTNEAASAPSSSCSASAATVGLLNFHDSTLFVTQNPNLNTDFEPLMLDILGQASDGGIFPEIGSFTSLMAASNPTSLGFNLSDISPFRFHHQQQQPEQQKIVTEEMKMPELTTGLMTVPVDLAEMRGRNASGGGRGFPELQWPSSEDQGLHDLGSSVDQSYWGQRQWADNDQPVYLP